MPRPSASTPKPIAIVRPASWNNGLSSSPPAVFWRYDDPIVVSSIDPLWGLHSGTTTVSVTGSGKP